MDSIKITHDAYPYLVAQRGALDDMRGDPETWTAKYCDVLQSEFRSIEPYLPAECRNILDVGSGMGGINALLNAYYGGDCEVCLLDGVEDPPAVELHRHTFNHMGIAKRFLEWNGVNKFSYIDANDAHRRAPARFDLIVSFKSWCFHYEPQRYLDLVVEACHSQTVLILDVRRDKPEYFAELSKRFEATNMIFAGVKFITYRFKPN